MVHNITGTIIKVRIGRDLVDVPPSNLALYNATKSLLMHGTSTRYPGYKECERCHTVFENPMRYTSHIRRYKNMDCSLLPLCAGCLNVETYNSKHGDFCENAAFSRLNRVCFLCNKKMTARTNLKRHIRTMHSTERNTLRYKAFIKVNRGEMSCLEFLDSFPNKDLYETLEIRNQCGNVEEIPGRVYSKIQEHFRERFPALSHGRAPPTLGVQLEKTRD
ncbi:hypothetical protein pipiens_000750, partial [Culex pipiens pipiens]